MAKRFCQDRPDRGARPASRQEQAVAAGRRVAAKIELKPFCQLPCCNDASARKQPHSCRGRRVHKAIDDCLRGISYGKHSAVSLGLQLYSALFEPVDGVSWGEPVERRDERALAAGITLTHRARIKTGVGNVAASTARDANLGQELRAALVDRNFIRRVRFSTGNRREEPGRASANDRDLLAVHLTIEVLS